MAKPSISYPLKIYDLDLWKRLLDRVKASGNSINKEIELALQKQIPKK
jgi:hypothetical protein